MLALGEGGWDTSSSIVCESSQVKGSWYNGSSVVTVLLIDDKESGGEMVFESILGLSIFTFLVDERECVELNSS